MATKTKAVKKTFVLPITENQVFYTTVKKHNLRDKTKAPLYYAQVHHAGRASLVTLQSRLCQMSSLSKGDVQSVLSNLMDVIMDLLREGKIIELGQLGNMYISVRSKGMEVEKDFSSANIKGAHIRFVAGTDLKQLMKSLSYLKLSEDAGTAASDTKSDGKGNGTDSGNTKGDSTNTGGSTGGNTGGDSDGGKI
jgi:predicted histone-like DNA-binding protein